MYILLIIFLIIITLLLWLLYTPLEVNVDTVGNEYYIKLKGIASIFLIINGTPFIKLRILFYKKEITLFRKTKSQKKDKKKKVKPERKEKKKKKNKSPAQIIELIKRIIIFVRDFINAWRINYIDANIDTGNFIINGLLYPVLYGMSSDKISLQSNFEGINYFRMNISSKLISFISISLKLLFDLKFKIRIF